MKHHMKMRCLAIAGLVWLLAGCGSTDKKGSDAAKILHAPPYAGLTDSIARFPKDAALYEARALLLSQNNFLDLATPDYQRAWELDPGEKTALDYASNLVLVKKIPEAVDLLKSCIKKYPSNTEFSRRLSEIYAQTGKDQEALQQFDDILQKDSLDFETWLNKAMLLAQMNDTAGAIAALERSFAIQPVNYTGIALANLYETRLNPKALQICDQLIRRDTANAPPDAWYIKGAYYSDTHQYAKAVKEYDTCIRRDWKFVDAYLDKGIILYEQRNFKQALETFNMAATVSNTNPDAWYWLGRCYEAMGQKDKAIANYRRTLELDKDFTEASNHLKKLGQ